MAAESGDTEHAGLLMIAGQQAAFSFDFPLARRLARAVWDAGAGVEAGHLLGVMLDTLGEHEAGRRSCALSKPKRRPTRSVRESPRRVANLFRALDGPPMRKR